MSSPTPTQKLQATTEHEALNTAWFARLELTIWRYGWWLPLALALSAIALVFWFSAAQLERQASALHQQALAARRAKAVTPPSLAASIATGDVAAEGTLRQALAPMANSTEQVRRLVALTLPALGWQQAEFQYADDTALGIVRLQVTVPVNGEYRQMRAALDRALLELPGLSIDQITFRRQKTSESQLESRVRLSLWLAGPTSPTVISTGTGQGSRP